MRRLFAIIVATLALPTTSAAAWPTWGNLESGDCAFAAAANWEMLHGGTNASEAQVLAEYRTISPNDGGISGEELETIWRSRGIAGRRESVHAVSPGHLRRKVRHYGALVAELAVTPGQRWQWLAGSLEEVSAGKVTDVPGGIHFAVVRYVNRNGPVLLTWGKLVRLTWWQWQEDVLLLYVPH